MGVADQLTVARIVAAPFVIGLYVWNFHGHAYWATALFIAAMATDQVDGWFARPTRPGCWARVLLRRAI